MPTVPEKLHQELRQHGQEHVLTWWHELSDEERHTLRRQLETLDLPSLRKLYEKREHAYPLPSPERIEPVACRAG